MPKNQRNSTPFILKFSFLLLFALTPSAFSCGDEWPDGLLYDSDYELQLSPETMFSEEIERISQGVEPVEWFAKAIGEGTSPEYWEPRGGETLDADLGELVPVAERPNSHVSAS